MAPVISRSILLVDDDPAVRDAVRFLLELEGYQVLAVTAPVALALLCSERPDLVLLDLDMPLVDGMDVRAHLLADPLTAAIPVVAMAEAGRLQPDPQRLQAQGVVLKPLNYAALLSEVARHI